MRVWNRRPEGGGATPGGFGVTSERPERHEVLEGSVDGVAIETAVKEGADLGFGQSVGSCVVESLFDAVDDVVSGSGAEEEWGACRAVLPYGKCSLEMGQRDNGAAIEGSIDGTEAQDLGFGPAGGGAIEAGTSLAQGGVAVVPKLARGVVAAKEDFLFAGCPIEGAAEFAGNSGELLGAQVAAFGEAFAPLHEGSEAAVGKAVMGFGRVEIGSELTLGDVGNEAEMGSGGLLRPVHIEHREKATIPSAAEQGR